MNMILNFIAEAFDIIDPLELQNIMQAAANSSDIVETDLTESNNDLEPSVSHEETECEVQHWTS